MRCVYRKTLPVDRPEVAAQEVVEAVRKPALVELGADARHEITRIERLRDELAHTEVHRCEAGIGMRRRSTR